MTKKPSLGSLIMPAGLTAAFLLSVFIIQKPINTKRSAAAGTPTPQIQQKGNGAPSGAHFNLNVIGVPKGKTANMTSGNRIFVPLTGTCKISLGQGVFNVLDANCTDGAAKFQLPNPDPENDGITTYSVWARALGKPGGKSTTTTCAYDADGTEWCSVYSNMQVRTKGKSTFTDVSKQLLYIYADVNGDGTVERYNLFNDALMDYYWNYDNEGLRLMQLRFYEVPSNVN